MTSKAPNLDRSILIVDDEFIIRLHLVDFFESEGFTVFEAGNADDAILTLEANPTIQVVLTDVQMPGSRDGLKLAHYVRHRYPPIILVVASGAITIEPPELPSHSAFVGKPFDPRFVLGEIERIAAQILP